MVSENISIPCHHSCHVEMSGGFQKHVDEVVDIKEHIRVDLHGVGGVGAAGAEPFKHDHGFNGEVTVAVQEVTLDNVMMSLAFL